MAALSWQLRRLWRDRNGQDLIEYALLASFVAVAVAAFFPTDIAPNISKVFSKISSTLSRT
jgi:Flp pilus assembly pilin Flp